MSGAELLKTDATSEPPSCATFIETGTKQRVTDRLAREEQQQWRI